MKKRMFTSLIIIILVLVSANYIFAKEPWENFVVEDGNLYSQDGVLLELPSEKDKENLVKSTNLRTNSNIKKLKTKVRNQLEETKKIQFNLDDVDTSLFFDYIIEEDKHVIINKPEKKYKVKSLPNSEMHLLEYNNSIYLIDIKQSKIKKLLKDDINGYNLSDSISPLDNGYIPVWAQNAYVNPSGTKIIFYTTRNVAKDRSYYGEIWVKDLISGEERSLHTGGYVFLGWDYNNNVFLRQLNTVIKINTETGIISKIGNIWTVAFSYPYLVSQKVEGTIEIQDVNTNDVREFTCKTLNSIGGFRTIEGSNWVIMTNYPDRTEIYRNIIVLNTNTFESRVIHPPANSSLENVIWHNSKEFLIKVRLFNTKAEKSIRIKLDDLLNETSDEIYMNTIQ